MSTLWGSVEDLLRIRVLREASRTRSGLKLADIGVVLRHPGSRPFLINKVPHCHGKVCIQDDQYSLLVPVPPALLNCYRDDQKTRTRAVRSDWADTIWPRLAEQCCLKEYDED